jgi:hypothetical protein
MWYFISGFVFGALAVYVAVHSYINGVIDDLEVEVSARVAQILKDL